MNSRPARAFTLIELLVSIAIIAVLAALVMTGIVRAQKRAYATQSMANIRALTQANLLYAGENGRYVPADDRFNLRRWHGARKAANQPFDPTLGFLADYLGKERRVIMCPMFKDMLKGKQSFEEGTGGYGYNSAYIGGQPGGAWDSAGLRVSEAPANVLNPGQTVMFTSSAYASANSLQEYAFAEPPYWDFGGGPSGARPSPSVHFRFDGKALAAWCDGRVSLVDRQLRAEGENPHGGNARAHELGWFGPDDNNGFWNTQKPE